MNQCYEVIYDVKLAEASIEGQIGQIVFVAPDGRRLQIQEQTAFTSLRAFMSFRAVGEVGRLTIYSYSLGGVWFEPYVDQRLRRRTDLDNKCDQLFAWEIDGRTIFVKSGLLPGKNGQVIHDKTEPLELDVPPEFTELCRLSRYSPETVLRSFIADLAGLKTDIDCPREDGYYSFFPDGSDVHMYAQQWFDRAYSRRGISRLPSKFYVWLEKATDKELTERSNALNHEFEIIQEKLAERLALIDA